MKQALDELSSINSWRGAVDESMGAMMLKQDATAARLLRLEHAPPPPPPPLPPFPPRPSGPGMQIDLNTAARASASTTDMFVGSGSPQDPLGEGGGVLGPLPHQGSGALIDSRPRSPDGLNSDREFGGRPHVPKMEFPKFDGTNPRLWRDQCQVYFEVYSVVPFLKTRFARLNFTGPTAIWLQSEERGVAFRIGIS